MAVFGMLSSFHRPEPDGSRFHARVEVDGETFDVLTDGSRLSLRSRPADQPDLTLHTTARDLVAARQGLRPLPLDAEPAVQDRFARLFQLT
jgi:hypothetical protein